MGYPAFITLPYGTHKTGLPSFEPAEGDIRYPQSLVRYFLEQHTAPGDRVFDPFAGLGTTMFVAESMKRIPYGIEFEVDRHEWVAGQMENWRNLIRGDSHSIKRYDLPKMDFSITSPPFMHAFEKWNPLCRGNPYETGYKKYLGHLRRIYGGIKKVMKKDSLIVLQIDNLEHRRGYTPLVRDIGTTLSNILEPIGETIIAWDGGPAEYRHTQCLLFRID